MRHSGWIACKSSDAQLTYVLKIAFVGSWMISGGLVYLLGIKSPSYLVYDSRNNTTVSKSKILSLVAKASPAEVTQRILCKACSHSVYLARRVTVPKNNE